MRFEHASNERSLNHEASFTIMNQDTNRKTGDMVKMHGVS